MGEIRKRKNGISYYMYNNDHPPPHIHVYFGNPRSTDIKIRMDIRTQDVLSGNRPSRKKLLEAAAWVQMNSQELLEMWSRRDQPNGVYRILE